MMSVGIVFLCVRTQSVVIGRFDRTIVLYRMYRMYFCEVACGKKNSCFWNDVWYTNRMFYHKRLRYFNILTIRFMNNRLAISTTRIFRADSFAYRVTFYMLRGIKCERLVDYFSSLVYQIGVQCVPRTYTCHSIPRTFALLYVIHNIHIIKPAM